MVSAKVTHTRRVSLVLFLVRLSFARFSHCFRQWSKFFVAFLTRKIGHYPNYKQVNAG